MQAVTVVVIRLVIIAVRVFVIPTQVLLVPQHRAAIALARVDMQKMGILAAAAIRPATPHVLLIVIHIQAKKLVQVAPIAHAQAGKWKMRVVQPAASRRAITPVRVIAITIRAPQHLAHQAVIAHAPAGKWN